ncbi:NADH-quinone oxidoreductase subunit 2 [Pirellula sp. SH-Sr6A]|uniref:NADH-quinone oxidoreductase subunit NuoE family protein n=1 Tax=Pirellula sp. SH-Sr6A TaxID=1632865 RepID=UPI00078E5BA5|nr:NAD(P)H-dependent oxidoreductase subunit E [Pirellula sp. SH-Sr6A]AMV32012.1 NADH-quinone oxidoreductase subunit 2 [Pirellula sp. SH-Sr6A]
MSELSSNAKKVIEDHIGRYPSKQAVTLPALHIVQEETGCVSNRAMKEIAEILGLSPAQIHDTMSFYGFFRTEEDPVGKVRVWICRSLPCMLRGGEELLAELCERWGVQPGGTTADGQITLELAECLGACDGAPCMLVNDELSLRVDADEVEKQVRGNG